ncbi:MAG: GH3 auxin-responsive promoter family protein [Halothece sp.]
MNSILQTPIELFARFVTHQFTRKTQRTATVQQQFLLSLLKEHQDTAFGRQYGFRNITTVEEFRKRIPVLNYRDYHPYVEQIAQGASNVLTADSVKYMNMTSGSTGKQKLIPVTKQSQRVNRQANLTSICFGIKSGAEQGLVFGQILVASSVQLLGQTPAGIPYGPVSVSHLRSMNMLARQLFAHPYQALEPSDSLARHYVCLLFALKNPHTRVIAANFPVLALRLCHYLENYAESLIEDLERGAIAPWLNLEPELRAKLEKKLTPAPKRAQQLRQVLHQAGRLTPILAWPELSCVVTARGGTSDFYLQRFPEYFGNTPVFGGIYSSAETMFGITPQFNQDGSILAIETAFFEFIPPQEWEKSQPRTLLAEEVKVGERYRIVVSNYNGFYRYDIGDVVEVAGFYGTAPLIVFRYRRGGLLSSTTEKTTEFHAIQVMQQLQQEFNLSLESFCITLSDDQTPPAYLVNIELSPDSSLPYPQQFLKQFDRRLKAIHASYEVKRRDQVPPPRLRILAPGSFAQLHQRLMEKGMPEHHLKFPHISEDRAFLADLTVEQEVFFPSDSQVSTLGRDLIIDET